MQTRYWISCLAVLFFGSALGQDVRLELKAEKTELKAGSEFLATLEVEIDPGWHIYSLDVPPGGPIASKITLAESDIFLGNGDPSEPEPKQWFDPSFQMQTNYHEGTVEFSVPVRVAATASDGSHTLGVKLRYQMCSDTQCLIPQTKEAELLVQTIGAAEAGAGGGTPPLPGGATLQADESQSASQPLAGVPRAEAASEPDPDSGGIPVQTLAYIWFAMGMGALALLTPCVFPMIPITVSYFTKRDAATRKRAVAEAAMYSIGIILTFTLLGFALTMAFGAGGLNRLAASPAVNLFIAFIFIVFALSLFGVLELALPNSWMNAINRKSSESGGILGIMLMALTFSLTSFTCTVPFVGTVMVAALQGDLLWSLLGVTAFATVFSLPFFLLAVFPSWLQSLPKSGNWMNSVKIVMGFLELAAALKFVSNIDLVYQWELITRPVFVAVWLTLSLVTSMYLLGWFHFKHEPRPESVGVGRVLFSVFFLTVSFYLLRGLFGFPLGELDAFLPPRDYGNSAELALFSGPADGTDREEVWLTDYPEALRVAQRQGKPVFIDFTGYTCTNCRWMEANIFPLPEVQELFSQYVLVRLYTDGTQEEHTRNLNFERDRFNTIALPLYAVMTPADEIVATFPGLTRDRSQFTAFLKKGLSYSADAKVVALRSAGN